MMSTTAGTGLSTDANPTQAARAAASAALSKCGCERADWGLVFVTAAHRPHYASMLRTIQGELGTRCLSGCSAWGVMAGADEVEGEAAVAVLAVRSDRITATNLMAPLGDDEAGEAAREIAALRSDRPGLFILLPDPFASSPDRLLRELNAVAPEARVVGAAASGDLRLGHTYQFYGRNVATQAIAGLYLSGQFESTIGVTQGCQPLGDPGRVTRGSGNLILELDGRPALEVLRSRLPASLRDSLERLGAHLFVGIPPRSGQTRIEPGEYLVRGILGIDPQQGSIAAGTSIEEGQPLLLLIREPHAAREDLKHMLARLGEASPEKPYRFGLYFNCAARGSSLYGLPGIDSAFISARFGDLPIVGFFGNAEIAPLRGSNLLFTHTGVLALIAEG
jgi:small ligand-binding sensory domain FIST